MTPLFVSGLASLFGRIRTDYSAHYSTRKQTWGEYLDGTVLVVITLLWTTLSRWYWWLLCLMSSACRELVAPNSAVESNGGSSRRHGELVQQVGAVLWSVWCRLCHVLHNVWTAANWRHLSTSQHCVLRWRCVRIFWLHVCRSSQTRVCRVSDTSSYIIMLK